MPSRRLSPTHGLKRVPQIRERRLKDVTGDAVDPKVDAPAKHAMVTVQVLDPAEVELIEGDLPRTVIETSVAPKAATRGRETAGQTTVALEIVASKIVVSTDADPISVVLKGLVMENIVTVVQIEDQAAQDLAPVDQKAMTENIAVGNSIGVAALEAPADKDPCIRMVMIADRVAENSEIMNVAGPVVATLGSPGQAVVNSVTVGMITAVAVSKVEVLHDMVMNMVALGVTNLADTKVAANSGIVHQTVVALAVAGANSVTVVPEIANSPDEATAIDAIVVMNSGITNSDIVVLVIMASEIIVAPAGTSSLTTADEAPGDPILNIEGTGVIMAVAKSVMPGCLTRDDLASTLNTAIMDRVAPIISDQVHIARRWIAVQKVAVPMANLARVAPVHVVLVRLVPELAGHFHLPACSKLPIRITMAS